MNPIFVTITWFAAWFIAALFAWAFVHGAQILRRQEAAERAAAQREADRKAVPSTPFTQDSTGLPTAA